jgi:hypothetical protein
LHNKPAGCGAAEAYASGHGSEEEEEEEEEEEGRTRFDDSKRRNDAVNFKTVASSFFILPGESQNISKRRLVP